MNSARNPLVSVASAIIIIAGIHFAASVVNVILLSFLLAMSVTPLMAWLINKRVKPGLAVALTVVAVLAVGLSLATMVGVSISQMITDLPAYEPRLIQLRDATTGLLGRFGVDISTLLSSQQLSPDRIISVVRDVLGAALGTVSMSLIILLIVVFILIEAAGHLGNVKEGKEDKGMMARYFTFGKDVRKYIGIVSLTGILTAVGNTILLVAVGVDYPVLWGVLSFLLNFVPSIGFVISLVPPAALALIVYGWERAVVVVVGFFIINAISENVIKPRFMKKGFDVSLLLIILSLIVWTWALGPVGTIVGVPLTMVLYRVQAEMAESENAARLPASSEPKT
jgi:AI-2 transport protein TqsA